MIDYANQFETKTCKLTMEKKLTKTDKNLIKNFITNCSSETTTGTKLSTHFNKRLPIETKRQQSSYSEKEGENEGQCIKKNNFDNLFEQNNPQNAISQYLFGI